MYVLSGRGRGTFTKEVTNPSCVCLQVIILLTPKHTLPQDWLPTYYSKLRIIALRNTERCKILAINFDRIILSYLQNRKTGKKILFSLSNQCNYLTAEGSSVQFSTSSRPNENCKRSNEQCFLLPLLNSFCQANSGQWVVIAAHINRKENNTRRVGEK